MGEDIKDIKDWILALAVKLDEIISRSPAEFNSIMLKPTPSCFII